jgi:hypothetical protein
LFGSFFPVFLQLFGLNFCLNAKKPAGLGRRRASGFFDLSGRFRSGHSSPPAWRFHDGGDDRDGGCSASDKNHKGN